MKIQCEAGKGAVRSITTAAGLYLVVWEARKESGQGREQEVVKCFAQMPAQALSAPSFHLCLRCSSRLCHLLRDWWLVLLVQEHHSTLGISRGSCPLCSGSCHSKTSHGAKRTQGCQRVSGASFSHEFGIHLPMVLWSFWTQSKKIHIACVRSQVCSSRGHRLATGCKLQLQALSLHC